MKRLGVLIPTGLLLLGGCGSVPHERAATGAGFGAASGAVAGAVISGLSVGTGALVGAGVGALVGALTRAEHLDLGPPPWRWTSETAEPSAFAAPSQPEAASPAPAHVPTPRIEPTPKAPPPAAATMASPPPPVLPRSYLVFFDWDRSDLTPEALKVVALVVSNARKDGVSRIETTGHADLSGPDGYNMRLSRRRAEAVRDELVRHGIKEDELATLWKGEREPLVPTPDGVREPQNRRAEIVFK
jgi:outer membrane protein OmpA-like peptidoglycan-associated protein